MRRLGALSLFAAGYAALAAFGPQLAALPAFASFLCAALMLARPGAETETAAP